jgi:uncharacterized membrane protein YhfC
MGTTFHLSSAWIAAAAAAYLFAILYPVLLAVAARRRLGAGWRYFWFGALIFAIFQLVTRVPAVDAIGLVFGKQIQSSPVLRWGWLLILAVTAGLFEEVGRYVGYRLLMRREEKTWNRGVMYGLGHGGLESILIVGLAGLYSLLQLVTISAVGLKVVPAAQRAQVAQQLHAIAAQPGWFPLLAAWERLWTIPVQVALSVMVLQVFRRGNIGWLWLAVLAHAVVDGVTTGVNQLLGPGSVSTSLIVEGIIAIFGLIAVWVTFVLRDRPERTASPEGLAVPKPLPELR